MILIVEADIKMEGMAQEHIEIILDVMEWQHRWQEYKNGEEKQKKRSKVKSIKA